MSDTTSGQGPTQHQADGSAWTLWLWVAAAFAFVAMLWTGMFMATRRVDTRTVPLAGQEAKP